MPDDDNIQQPAAGGGDTEALQRSIEALERKNKELADEKRRLRQFEKMAQDLPDGVSVTELLEFKRRSEQQQLEAQGDYKAAQQRIEQQYRDDVAARDARIAELEARVRELELISPAVSALADLVHDPDLILKTKLSSDRIEREPDGTVVVVDGYQRVPVADWARTLPAWMQKQPKPQGSGAPSATAGSSGLPPGVKNPFLRESFNLTEQSRLYRTDPALYERLKSAANM